MNSIQRTARLAGFLYLLLVPLGVFGILYVPSTLIIPGDIAATISNIKANELLFRLSIATAILAQLVNVIVVLLLYKVLKPVNKDQARLMVIFLLLGVPIAFLNELTHLAILQLLSDANTWTMFTVEQQHAFVSLLLDLHSGGLFIAQVFWGLWLFPMGYLVFKSGFLPRIIGILLMIGCLGYLMDSFTHFLFPNFDVTVSEYTFIGELLITLWLLIKGVNVERWEKRAAESA